VYEFAEYLGMDVSQDQEFLWIAVEAMFAPLPRNWQEFENESGQIYYYNHRLGAHVAFCPLLYALTNF
jgi:centrosomal protein CEP164